MYFCVDPRRTSDHFVQANGDPNKDQRYVYTLYSIQLTLRCRRDRHLSPSQIGTQQGKKWQPCHIYKWIVASVLQAKCLLNVTVGRCNERVVLNLNEQRKHEVET